MAPPYDFLERAFLPLVRRMGPRVGARLERWGFYPAGGGRVCLEIEPLPQLQPLELLVRGPILKTSARAVVANLPRSIAERELQVVHEGPGIETSQSGRRGADRDSGPRQHRDDRGRDEPPQRDHQRLRRARSAGEDRGGASSERGARLSGIRPARRRPTDQLIIPAAMSGGGAFRTGPLSRHAATNIDVVRTFLRQPIPCRALPDGTWEVRFGPLDPLEGS